MGCVAYQIKTLFIIMDCTFFICTGITTTPKIVLSSVFNVYYSIFVIVTQNVYVNFNEIFP